jgi:hypothetical protein
MTLTFLQLTILTIPIAICWLFTAALLHALYKRYITYQRDRPLSASELFEHCLRTHTTLTDRQIQERLKKYRSTGDTSIIWEHHQ